MVKSNGKRLKYRYRPCLAQIMYDLQDEVLKDRFSYVYRNFKLDALMGSSAFRLLRLDFLEYFMVFSYDGMYYSFEIRKANDSY